MIIELELQFRTEEIEKWKQKWNGKYDKGESIERKKELMGAEKERNINESQ